MMLKLKYRLAIYPIAIYLSPGAGGLTTERHVDEVFGEEINVFKYKAVGLPDLDADNYLYVDNPLGPALSALMKTSRLGRVAQMYQSLRAMAQSQLDEARKALLTNVITTYLTLTDDEQIEFKQLIAKPENKEVGTMITIFEQRGIEIGEARGVLRGKRETLLRLMRLKFGALPEALQTRLEAVSDAKELDALSDRIITAKSLEEMALQ